MKKQVWIKSPYPGVRYREHETRRLSPGAPQKDRYYVIRYKVGGKDKEESLGWASKQWTDVGPDGKEVKYGWTEKRAAALLAELQENQRLGTGPRTLKEKREIADRKRAAMEAARQEQEIRAKQESVAKLTFGEIFEGLYMDEQRLSGKKATSIETETVLFKKWINPAIGNLPLAAIGKADLDAIRTTMLNKGMAMRSFLYALAIISQVFNLCIGKETFFGPNPVSIYKKARRKQLTFDNKKQRFLSETEADKLLKTIKARSLTLHHVCMVSLYAGLRASEIFRLSWADVDLVNGFLFIKDTKAGSSRNVPLHEILVSMFREIGPGDKTALVFTGKGGKPLSEVSRTFDRCVDDLKLNEGIEDRRQRLTFHNLRHSCASWLVMQGVDLYTVGKLLGHTTTRMTERYSHLSEEHLKQAIGKLGKKGDMGKVIPLRSAANE